MWPFADKELLLTEIAGFRANEKYTSIHPTQPGLPTLQIAGSTVAYHDLQFWFSSQYPDLDQTDAAEAMAALLADEQLGNTPEERADRLAQAKRVSTALYVLSGLVIAWLVTQLGPYLYFIGAGVALPLLVAGALLAFRGLLRLEISENSPLPSVALALLLPCGMLVGRALSDGNLVAYAAVWPIVGGVAIAFALLLLLSSRYSLLKRTTPRSGSEWVLLFSCAAAYGFGATLTSNAAFDQSRPTLYPAQVLAKHQNNGKSNSCYLTLSSWGPRTASDDIAVSLAYYQAHAPGDTVRVIARPGRLGIPWFRLEE